MGLSEDGSREMAKMNAAIDLFILRRPLKMSITDLAGMRVERSLSCVAHDSSLPAPMLTRLVAR
jgi:hypothetical protein